MTQPRALHFLLMVKYNEQAATRQIRQQQLYIRDSAATVDLSYYGFVLYTTQI